MGRTLPDGTVTFLFTDIEGSTALLHAIGPQAYAAALAEHRGVIRDAINRLGGSEVDTQGDAFFVAFSDASAAAQAAADITARLSTGPVRVRIGLHTGQSILTDGGYVGDDVHLGARLTAGAHGGQIVVSSATASLLSGNRDRLVSLGEHRFKDYPHAVGVFQLGTEPHPPLRSISNTNLPTPASTFVGRTADVGIAVDAIRGGSRIVTLTGAGGSGKTRLAIEAAHEVVRDFAAGVFWVGLEAIASEELVLPEVARVLGATDLGDWIGDRSIMLVLDNVEQVIHAGSALAALAERCPGLALLVTSRERLNVRGEVEIPVPPLTPHDAVELFVQRSGLVPSPPMETLVRQLDCLPLAIELAASRTRAFTIEQIQERLGSRLDFLVGARDMERRQKTLRATIDWSHELLSTAERSLFRRMAVFASPAELRAVQRITECDLDTLQSLVEKSLVRVADGRYAMLETIRTYAMERLIEAGEYAAAHEALVGHIEALARTIPQAPTGEYRSPARPLEHEVANVRTSMEYLDGTGQHERLLRLTSSIGGLWALGGYWVEGRRWIELGLERGHGSDELRADAIDHVLDLAFQLGDYDAVRRYCRQNLDYYRSVENLRGVAFELMGLGLTFIDTDRAECMRLLSEARGVASQAGSDLLVARIDGNVGWIEATEGHLESASVTIAAACDTFRALGQAGDLRAPLLNLAHCEARLGRMEAMRSAAREGLESAIADGDHYSLAVLSVLAAWLRHSSLDAEARCELLGLAEAELDRLHTELVDLDADMQRHARADVIAAVGEPTLATSRLRGQSTGIAAAIPLLHRAFDA